MTRERRRLIAAALGGSPTTILEIDHGYDFEVAIVDDEWVFRFPRRAGVEEALEVEIALLPALAPALPVALPAFEHVSREPLFVGYRLLRGEPLVDEDPDGVRAFLDALHALDPAELPVARRDWGDAYRDQCAEFERLVLPHLDRDRHAQAARLFAEVETLVGFEPALVHADLGPDHLLVRDGRLSGVIDWGDARVGDPALDYAWLLHGPFADWRSSPSSGGGPASTTASCRGTKLIRPLHRPAGTRRTRPGEDRGDAVRAVSAPRTASGPAASPRRRAAARASASARTACRTA